MSRSKNAKIQMEQGQTLVDFVALTDSGDNTNFTPADAVMSGADGFAPDVRPNGIVTGLNLVKVAASGSNDVIDVSAFTAYEGGTLHSVSATADTAITRPVADVSKVNSITMTTAGAITVVAGVDGSTAAFSETRGAAGGPPLIPVDSIEIGQVRTTTSTAAPITADEIFQVVGQHAERFDFPLWEENNVGLGTQAEESAQVNAFVKFNAALPVIHTGAIPKAVYAKYYIPVLADLLKTADFVPAETSHSTSSTEYYGGVVNSTSESLGQASFTALLVDGVNDAEVVAKNKVLTFKFFPDRNKAAYILQQGVLGISRTFGVADQKQASMTVSPETSSAEFAS